MSYLLCKNHCRNKTSLTSERQRSEPECKQKFKSQLTELTTKCQRQEKYFTNFS